MATAKKLPSGNWRVQVFSHKDENGKPKYVSFTAATKAEANRQAAEFQANRQFEDKPQDLTVGAAVKKYIDKNADDLSPKTLLEYRRYEEQYYKSVENIKIGSLTSTDLQNYVDFLSKTRKPKTVRNIYSLLHSAITAYSNRNYSVKLPKKTKPERNIPTDKDVKNLIESASPKIKIAIILGSHGMRRGEIASLKFKDILYDFNAVYIHSDMVQGKDADGNTIWVYKDPPKTEGSIRRLTLPKEVIDMLGHGDPEDYVLGLVPSTITSDFSNLRDRLGLKCRFHDLRHYMASILHAINVPDAYIMERGGWVTDTVLKSVYINSLSDKSAHYTSVANDYFTKNIMGNDNKNNIKAI